MSHRTQNDFERIQSLGLTLGKARNLVAAEMDAALKDVGISSQQLSILLALSRDAAQSAVQLSRMLAVDSALMTRALDKLEARGLVQRTRSEADRRRVDLAVTQEGHDAIARCERAEPSVRLSRFTNPEIETLGRLLGKLVDG
jgi:DNA-binding MarR family transcriptional regulator